MKVKLDVSYHYIPHLDKPQYGNIEPGYYKIFIQYTGGTWTSQYVNKAIYLPLHLDYVAIDLCKELIIDPVTPWLSLDLMRYILNKEKEVSEYLVPVPDFSAEMLMITSYEIEFDAAGEKYNITVDYYASDHGIEFSDKKYCIKDKDVDLEQLSKRMVEKMFRFLSHRNVYNLVNDDNFY